MLRLALSALLCLAVFGLVARASVADPPSTQLTASYQGAPYAGWITVTGTQGVPFQIRAQGPGGDWLPILSATIPASRSVTVPVLHPFPGGATALYSVSFGPISNPWTVIVLDGFDGWLWD